VKFRIQTILMATAVLALAGGTAAYAFEDVAIATVKTPFMVGHRLMPAGTYEVEVTSIGALLLHSKTTGVDSPLVMPIARTPYRASEYNPQLVFDRVGKTLALAQVRVPGEEGYLLMERPASAAHVSAMKRRG
jgi:hypothetical protein